MILKKLISSTDFQRDFLKDLPDGFQWQETPLQVYPMSFIAKHIIMPLPFFQASNNHIIHIRQGSLRQLIGTDYYDIEAPALLVVLNETMQSLQAISPDALGHIVLMEDLTMSAMFKQEDLLNLFVIEPVLKLSEAESRWIHTINKFLHTEVTKALPNRKIAEGLLQSLLYYILELSRKRKPLSRNQQIAIKFKQLVHMHYKDHKNIPFYANELHISENYLNRCIKAVFQKTSKELIMEVIVLQAQLLLWDFSKDIAEIAYELQIEDASYFSRIFKKITQQTPTEYRISIMHDLS